MTNAPKAPNLASKSGYKIKIGDAIVVKGLLKKTQTFPLASRVTVVDTRRFSTGKLLATGLIGGATAGKVSLIITGPDGDSETLNYTNHNGADQMVRWAAQFQDWQAVQSGSASPAPSTSSAVS